MSVTEQWRPIAGWQYFEVSDQGRIRSLDRVTTDHRGPRRWKGRIRKPGRSGRHGHLTVHLSEMQGARLVQKTVAVHLAVLEAFAGPRPDGMQGLHENDLAQDNRLSNLRWGTPTDNRFDSVRNGGHHETRRDQCKRGHLRAGSNLDPSKPYRACLACRHGRSVVKSAAERGLTLDVQVESDRWFAEHVATDHAIQAARSAS